MSNETNSLASMTKLVLLHRNGLLVLSGTVSEVDGAMIVIEDDVELTVTGGVEKRRIHLEVRPDDISSMKLHVGAKVIATATDNEELAVICEGGQTIKRDYCLSAYHIRYSGAFDFKERDGDPEEHVFSGIVENICSVMVGERACMIVTLCVRVGNENVPKVILMGADESVRKGDKRIFVTSAGKKNREGTMIYPCKKTI